MIPFPGGEQPERPLRLEVMCPLLAHDMLIFGRGVTFNRCNRVGMVTWIERQHDGREERWELREDGNYHLVRDTAGD